MPRSDAPDADPAAPPADPSADSAREAELTGGEAGQGAEAEAAAPGPKQAQILAGARRCFLARGFDAASMGEIAREAGVSKGTLYVYFDGKETLFREMIVDLKRRSAERLAEMEWCGAPLDVVLTRFGERLLTEILDPEHVALLRMVIGAAERFPDIGEAVFEAGPRHGAERLARVLAAQAEAGVLDLHGAPAREAAWRLLALINQPFAMAAVMGGAEPPGPAEIEAHVRGAVAAFLRAHAPRG